MAVQITQTAPDEYTVDPNGEEDITLATAGTYVDKNIKFLINNEGGGGIEVHAEAIENRTSKCLVFTHAVDTGTLDNTILS